MEIHIISVLPELIESPFQHSILKRAEQKGLVKVFFHSLRAYSKDAKHQSIDDYAFGGGAGMVMMVEPIFNCIAHLKQSCGEFDEIIYMSPDGDLLNQKMANFYSLKKRILILCGHYKGVDERVRTHLITREVSIGDYVLSGGELAAAVFSDAIIRLLPGVLNDETSALTDSFQDDLIAPPVYTRPAEFKGWKVPDILLSGNTPEVEKWRLAQSVARTKERRPKLWDENE